MTYVTEQTSAELRAHMKRLKAMPGWHEPLADRLYEEVQALDERNAELLEALRNLLVGWEHIRNTCRVSNYYTDETAAARAAIAKATGA